MCVTTHALRDPHVQPLTRAFRVPPKRIVPNTETASSPRRASETTESFSEPSASTSARLDTLDPQNALVKKERQPRIAFCTEMQSSPQPVPTEENIVPVLASTSALPDTRVRPNARVQNPTRSSAVVSTDTNARSGVLPERWSEEVYVTILVPAERRELPSALANSQERSALPPRSTAGALMASLTSWPSYVTHLVDR